MSYEYDHLLLLLPSELLIEIFNKLPVTTLIRCTSVCKSWYSLITSPFFISTHLKHQSINYGNGNKKILVRNLVGRHHRILYGVDRDYYYSVHTDNETCFDKLATLDFPPQLHRDGGYFSIVGSFNGLLCLSGNEFYFDHTLYLWNPSIRKLVTLPRLPIVNIDHHPRSGRPYYNLNKHTIGLGFGFHSATNDYKVVRLVYLQPDRVRIAPVVDLYQLSTGCWRRINSGDYLLKYVTLDNCAQQAFLNGVVHWTGCDYRQDKLGLGFPRLIVSFDMKNDEFGALMVPPCLEQPLDLSVAVFRDSLCLIQDFVSDHNNYCSIWVMKEYGAAESWTKLFTIDKQYGNLVKAIGFREHGDVLFLQSAGYGIQHGELVSYDPKSKQIKNLGIFGLVHEFYKDTYVESLVLVKGLGTKEN